MNAAMSIPAVAFEGVTRRFGNVQALAGIDLAVAPGEFFGLLGPNGAGKTTLISILAGLVRADRGHARVLGHDVVDDYREARSLLGVVPQELVFDPFFTVRETLSFQAGYFGIRDADAWIDEILEHLGLTAKANANMRSLSGGMKRRVLVGQALVHKPPVIVLDEPTAGRRRRAAPQPVDVHPQAQRRRPHGDPHHALPRGGRGAVRPHRDAEGRPRRGARLHAQPARALSRAHGAPRRGAAARALVPARAAPGQRAVPPVARQPRRARAAARGPARGGASTSRSSRSARRTSSRCSCASCRRAAPAQTRPPPLRRRTHEAGARDRLDHAAAARSCCASGR